jgi:hypothetical protein
MKREPYPTLEQFDRAHRQLARPAEVAQKEAKPKPTSTF